MKKTMVLLLMVCICLSICACGKNEGVKKNSVREISPGVVEVDGCRVEIYGYYERVNSYVLTGSVYIRFTNNSGENCSLTDKVEIRAYQNGAQCSNYMSGYVKLFDVDHTTKVLNGSTVETGRAFKVKKDVPILIQIVVAVKVVSEVKYNT